MKTSAPRAVRATHQWFDRHSGWSPPDEATLGEWLADGVCRCPDDCQVAPASTCSHGLASWWLVLRTLDNPTSRPPLAPDALTPAQDRLDPGHPGFVTVMDAHHEALLEDRPGYIDPLSGFYVMTARSLWDRGRCCTQGCRHCPFVAR